MCSVWGLCVDYSSSAVQCVQRCMYICSGLYANNVKCMYSGVPVHIVDYRGALYDAGANGVT